MPSPGKRIGEKVRQLRKAMGLSQEELAHKTDLGTSYLSALERGEKNPTVGTLMRISDVLDTTLAELIAGDEIRAVREVEELLKDVPARLRGPVLRVLRETVLLHREAIAEYSGRRPVRA